MSVREGDYVHAIYDFDSTSPTDLSLKVNDVVKVTEVINENWARGHKLHQVAEGIFPLAFVERLHLPSIRTGQRIFVAHQDFVAEQNGDLELVRGDVIIGTEVVDESWWSGKNGPLKGIFPLSFVVEIQQEDGVRSRSVSSRSNSLISRTGSMTSSSSSSKPGFTQLDNPVIAQALVNVTPQLDGELAFQIGDLVEITALIDNDWMYGRCREKEGLVSSVCVELLEDASPVTEATTPISDYGGTDRLPSPTSDQRVITTDDDPIRSGSYVQHPRTATTGSYTSENTRSHDAEITPYARVLYSFSAQYSSEVSLKENQIVSLIQHLNPDWTEGDVDGKRGMFPTNFIEIIVDCPYNYSPDSLNANIVTSDYESNSQLSYDSSKDQLKKSNDSINTIGNTSKEEEGDEGAVRTGSRIGKVLEKQTAVEYDDLGGVNSGSGISAGISEVVVVSDGHEIGLVLHSFEAEIEGDVSVNEGDTVEVIGRVDDNWIQVQLDSKKTGVVPANHIEIIGLWPKNTKEGEIQKSQMTKNVSSSPRTPMTSSQSFAGQSTSTDNFQTPFAGQSTPTEHEQVFPPSKVTKSKIEAQTFAVPKPKPTIAQKPVIAPKPSVMKKPSTKTSAAFYTAKPFSSSSSSTSATTASSVPYPNISNQKQQTIPSLDNIIQDEITKAKSRSSSLNSTTSTDSYKLSSELESNPATTTTTNTSATPTTTIMTRGMSVDVKIISNTAADVSTFDPFKAPAANSNPTNQNTRPPLVSSMSLPANPDSSKLLPVSTSIRENISPSIDTSTKSTTPANSTSINKPRADPPNPTSSQPSSRTRKAPAFVNPAYEHEIDEGVLIPNLATSNKVLPPSRPPPRITNPSQPVSSILSQSVMPTTTGALPSKFKGPPPRPTGPRLALAPSRTPLVPIRVAPQPPGKSVPARQAPPIPMSVVTSTVASTLATTSQAVHMTPSSIGSKADKENISQKPSLRRPPPRPTSFALPPKRPPPMSHDLIKFSPERNLQVEEEEKEGEEEEEEEELDEEKKEIVSDLKKRIAEAVTDIKTYVVSWTPPLSTLEKFVIGQRRR